MGLKDAEAHCSTLLHITATITGNESDLQVTTSQHNVVHLFHGQERCLWNLVLNECVSLMLVCKMVVTKADSLHGTERQESLLDRVLVNVEVYTTNIDAANKRSHTRV